MAISGILMEQNASHDCFKVQNVLGLVTEYPFLAQTSRVENKPR